MSFDKETLTLDEDLFVNLTDSSVQALIRDVIKCDKLVINGTTNTFHPDFVQDPLFTEFWKKVGESVNTLELNELTPVSYLKYLPFLGKVRNLSIGQPSVYQDVLPIFHATGVALEVLNIAENVLSSKLDIKTIDTLTKTLFLFKTTLKTFTIGCSIVLERETLTELMTALNTSVWLTNEVIIECDPIPNNFPTWEIDRIQLNIATEGDISKLIVKPLSLKGSSFNRDMNQPCQMNCSNNHQFFKCNSVEMFSFDKLQRCQSFYQSCFNSFPFIVKLEGLVVRDLTILSHLSDQLVHLTDLMIMYDLMDYDEFTLPSFPRIQKFSFITDHIEKKNFKILIQAMPNLKELSFTINERLLYLHTLDAFIRIITENLKNLELLSIYCYEMSLTALNLRLIGFKLKNLKELHAFCTEPYSAIETLFSELPSLKVFYNGTHTFLRRSMQMNPLANQKCISDLPPELLEKIFLNLTPKEQKVCRQVCKRWFNTQASNSKFYTTLDLKYSYLSFAIEPVTLFVNTDFGYNKIIFNGTTFAGDEDLTSFWMNIGRNVQEICIASRHLNIATAVKTGFKACYFPKVKKLTIEILPLFYDLLDQDIEEWKLLLDQVEHFSINYLFGAVNTKHVEYSMPNVTQLTIDGCMTETQEIFFQRMSFPRLETLIILHVSYESIGLEDIFETKFDFGHIKTLLIGNYYQWVVEDFQLIAENCLGLETLGIGFITKHTNSSNSLNYNVIPKMMFDKIASLKSLYFVTFKNNTKEKYYRTYKRGERSLLKESQESHPVFDEIDSFLSN